LSADASSMRRVLHGDQFLLKYSYVYVIERGTMQASATVDYNIDAKRYREALRRLEKAKGELSSPVHRELLELFIYDVIAENHSPYDVYTKISRLAKFLKWLENAGKDIRTCTGFDVTRFLVAEVSPSNRHRIAADIKRFIRFLKEKIDEKYEELYRSFKVKKPKEYPLPPLPSDELIELILKNSSTFYKALFSVVYGGTQARRSAINKD